MNDEIKKSDPIDNTCLIILQIEQLQKDKQEIMKEWQLAYDAQKRCDGAILFIDTKIKKLQNDVQLSEIEKQAPPVNDKKPPVKNV